MKREPIIDPVIERPLLGLHRATNIDSFWKAARRLVSAAIPNHLIRLTFQHNPVLPMIVKKPGRCLTASSPQNRSGVISPADRAKGSCELATSFQIEAA